MFAWGYSDVHSGTVGSNLLVDRLGYLEKGLAGAWELGPSEFDTPRCAEESIERTCIRQNLALPGHTMDLADDERIRQLTEKIQNEKDTNKLSALVDELNRLLDSRLQSNSLQGRNPPQSGN